MVEEEKNRILILAKFNQNFASSIYVVTSVVCVCA